MRGEVFTSGYKAGFVQQVIVKEKSVAKTGHGCSVRKVNGINSASCLFKPKARTELIHFFAVAGKIFQIECENSGGVDEEMTGG